MKATTLLEKQHTKAKAALKKLMKAYDEAVLDQLASELAAHMVIEETIFYPAVRKVMPDLVAEAYEEHALAQVALQRLLRTDANDERFEARATALFDLLDHHIDEEQDELFPKVNKALPDAQLKELGADMETAFDELVARGHRKVLSQTMGETTADASSANTAAAR